MDETLNLQALLKEEPWPEEFLSKGKPVEWFWKFDLDVNREALWPYISDTSRFNRELGLPEMKFWEYDGKLFGRTKNLGIELEWEEVPWSWLYARKLIGIRKYSKGFAWYVRSIYRLFESDQGTAFFVYFGWIPRGFLGKIILKLAERNIRRNYERLLQKISKAIHESIQEESMYFQQAPRLQEDAEKRLDQIQSTLEAEGSDPELANRLIHFVKTGDEMNLYKIRIRKLANEWGVNERELLRTALYATRAGLLNISWDVICPHCRGVRNEANHLGEIPKESNCEVCDIDFSNDREDSIEIHFQVNPSIREVPKRFYCSAEPAQKKHILIQEELAPGERRSYPISLPEGGYRFRKLGEMQSVLLRIDSEKENTEEILLKPEQFGQTVYSRPLESVEIENSEQGTRTFILETLSWDPYALRPAQIFNMQDFYELFSDEYLAADIRIEVGKQTILFTDMVGSTKFYREYGDSKAFLEVKRHFERIYEIVDRNQGAVIKTIGDAVMAAFPREQDAIRASIELQKLFSTKEAGLFVSLRISVHSGNCLAVNLNSSIDYFGNTVNLASKLQKAAGAQQIAFSETVFQSTGVQEILQEYQLRPAKLKVQIPSMQEFVEVYRVEV